MQRRLFRLISILAVGFAVLGGARPEKPPTFYQDVLPILANRCQGCHRPGEVAPMSLLTYEEARPWAKAIRESVARGSMPPWFADPSVGHKYSNDRSLSRREIETLLAWVDAGAPKGQPAAAASKALPAATGWRLGQPDKIYEMGKYEVPAKGIIEYTYYIIPTDFAEDRWITAAELKVGSPKVVHHINAFIREPDNNRFLRGYPTGKYFVAASDAFSGAAKPEDNDPAVIGGANGGIFGEILAPYEPGFFPAPWGEGQAKLLKAGSDIVVQFHYTANGTPTTDQTQLGLTFARKPPKERVLTWAPANTRFVIPPGEANHRVDYEVTVMKPARLISMQPHMHLRGKSFEYRVRPPAGAPNGQEDTLLRVRRYNFNWQINYYLAEPLLLAPGTRLAFTAIYDNSPDNPWNPDPKSTVKWGDQSWEEMMIGFFEVAFDARFDANSVIHRTFEARKENGRPPQ